MRTLGPALLNILFCLLWLGCTNLDNSYEEAQLNCGAEVDLSAFSLIKLGDWQAQEFTAVLETEGEYVFAEESSQGCIKIPKDLKKPLNLIVRSNERAKGFILRIPGQRLDFVNLTGIDELNERLRNQKSSFVCQNNFSHINSELPVVRIDQRSDLLTFTALQYQVIATNGQLVQVGNLVPDTQAIRLNPSLPEGRYKIQLSSKDVFEPNTAPLRTECSFIIDRTAPLISSSLSNRETIADAGGSKKVSPAEKIVFSKGNDPEVKVFACTRKRTSEQLALRCDESADFRDLDSITTDLDGIWDLSYYAVDQAGNRSETVHETYSIFNQQSIDQIQDQLSIAQLNDALGNQKQNFQSIERAANIINDFDLNAERDPVRWPFLEGFWNLDQKLSLVGSIQEGRDVRQLAIAENGRRFITVLDNGVATVYEGSTKRYVLLGVKRAAFVDDERLWVYTDSKKLSLIQAGRTEFTQNVEMDEARLAVDPTGLTAVLWDDKKALVVNRAGVETLAHTERPKFSPPLRFEFSRNGDFFVGSNDSTISVYSLSNISNPLTYTEPKGCVIGEFVLRGTDEIYLTSQWNRRLGIKPDDAINPCGLKKLKFRNGVLESSSLKELYPKNVTVLTRLAISKDPDESLLLLIDGASAIYYSFDLRQEDQPAKELVLADDDRIVGLDSVVGQKPAFLIRTNKNLLSFVSEISGNFTALFQERRESGTCMPQSESSRIYCVDGLKGQEIRIYSFSRAKTLQPNFFIEQDQLSDSLINAYQLLDVSRDLRFILIGQETKNKVVLQERDGKLLAEHLLPNQPLFVSLGSKGQSALALTDGRIGTFAPGQPIAWFDAREGRTVIQLKQAGVRTLVLFKSESGLELVSLIQDQSRLVLEQSLSFTNSESYDQLIVNDQDEFATLYKLSRGVTLPQLLPVIRLADFALIKALKAQVAQLEWQENTSVLPYAQERSIRRFDAATEQDSEVASDLEFQPNFVLGTKRLFAVDEKVNLWDLELKKIVGGLFWDAASGPLDSLLLGPFDGNLQVLDASNSEPRATLQLSGRAKVIRFYTIPGSADFAFSYYEPFVGYGVKIMTTDLAKARDWLRSW